MSATSRGIQLPRIAIIRLGRLLPMEYSPSELAHELSIHAHQIRQTALPAGCPHRRDAKGRIWIVGAAFRDWYRGTQAKSRHPLGEAEAWCLRCGKAVPMAEPFQIVPRLGTSELVKARCTLCGAKVNRLRSRQRVGAS